MGISHSWVAVKTADRAAVLAELGLEVSDDGRKAIRGFGVTELPGPWVLLLKTDYDWAFKVAQALSKYGLTVACGEEEHVMASDAYAYDGGALVWRVTHDPDIEARQLQISGAPPTALTKIHDDLRAEQAASDEGEGGVNYIFDAPPLLAQELVGFRITDAFADDFHSQALRKVGRPGLIQRLFGARQ